VRAPADESILAGVADEEVVDIGFEGTCGPAGQGALFQSKSFGGCVDGYDAGNEF
jgi:hypothetical protein